MAQGRKSSGSLTKKYVYIHKCSLADHNPDNFRLALGRVWVPSENLGYRYGYEVDPAPMNMTFGQVLKWEQPYFGSTNMPASTQIVSIRPNPHFFPPINDELDQNTPGMQDEPCCGWYAYLGRFYLDHFSSGQPIGILRSILSTRVKSYFQDVVRIDQAKPLRSGSDTVLLDIDYSQQIDDRFFKSTLRSTTTGDKCVADLAVVYGKGGDQNPQNPQGGGNPGAIALFSADKQFTSLNTTTDREIQGLTQAGAEMRDQQKAQLASQTGQVLKQANGQSNQVLNQANGQSNQVLNQANGQNGQPDNVQPTSGPIATTPDNDDGQNPPQPPKDPTSVVVRLFRDIWFQQFTPFSEEESLLHGGAIKAMVSDLKMNYNFFLAAYEKQAVSIPEVRIPNLYLSIYKDGTMPYVLYLTENIECRYKEFAKLILQRGYKEYLLPVKQQPFIQDKNIYSKSFPMDATISFSTDRNTFVADALEDSKLEANMLRRVSEGAIHTSARFFGDDPDGFMKAGAESSLPAEEISIPRTIIPSPYANAAALPGVPDPNMQFAVAKRYYNTLNTEYTAMEDRLGYGHNDKSQRSLRLHTGTNPDPKLAPAAPYKTFDFYQWLMSLPDTPASSVDFPQTHVFLGRDTDSTDMALRSGLYQPELSYLANYFILSGKINEIAKTHLRTYQQMMRGDTPHSETILYKVSKFRTKDIAAAVPKLVRQLNVNETMDELKRAYPKLDEQMYTLYQLTSVFYRNEFTPIQNYWIPNSNSIDVVEYIDTQIKYEEDYTYLVTAYELSVGTEYFYSQYFGKNAPPPIKQPQPCTGLRGETTGGPLQYYGPIKVTQTQTPGGGIGAYAGLLDFELKRSETDSVFYAIIDVIASAAREGDMVDLRGNPSDVPFSRYNLIVDYLERLIASNEAVYTEGRDLDPITDGVQVPKYFEPRFETPVGASLDRKKAAGNGILITVRNRRFVNKRGDTADTAMDLYVHTYCFDAGAELADDEEVVIKLDKLVSTADPSPPSGIHRNQGDEACQILAQMRAMLSADVKVLDRSDTLLEAKDDIEAAIALLGTKGGTKKGVFLTDECPDGWKEGKIEVQTFQDKGQPGTENFGGNLEVTFTGKLDFRALCECPPPEPCQETFLATTFPCLKVHEIPYMLWSGVVTDSYPVGPDVEIVPYRAVNNELLFKINSGLGDYYDYPVPITKQDAHEFGKLEKNQRSQGKKVNFKSDDPVLRFEMYRLSEKPRRYSDFAKGEKSSFGTQIPGLPHYRGGRRDAVSTIEKLVPNKKYYYIFRAIDVHGHPSNPTPIYEVEIVDNDGAIYPLINIYDPEPDLPVDLSKQGQRLLQVRPEYLQSIVNERTSGLKPDTAGTPGGDPSGTIRLGVRDKSLFTLDGRTKFKLRLTSCETRRMLDINLRFKNEHVVTADICPPENESKQSSGNEGVELPNKLDDLMPKEPDKKDFINDDALSDDKSDSEDDLAKLIDDFAGDAPISGVNLGSRTSGGTGGGGGGGGGQSGGY